MLSLAFIASLPQRPRAIVERVLQTTVTPLQPQAETPAKAQYTGIRLNADKTAALLYQRLCRPMT